MKKMIPLHARTGLLLSIAVLSLSALTSQAQTPYFTGGFGYVPVGSGTYTSSSFTLTATNLINGPTSGSFASMSGAGLTAYSTTVSGLSSTPTAFNIPNFLVFSSNAITSGNGNRYSVTLTSMTRSATGAFDGMGVLVDSLGQYQNTPAFLSLSYTATGGNYSGTVSAIPEPTTALLVAGTLCVGFCSRRRRF